MSKFEKYTLGMAASDAAREIHYNDEKREAFLKGAEWMARHLWHTIEPHPMEGADIKASMDKLRIKNVKEILNTFLSPPKKEAL